MSYTVLARKYRSWTFDEIVGQDAIATTLKNAINSGRVHHGYLFTGTRGVGKTSMARILARSLNCLNRDGPSVDPCRECESCRAVAEGEDMDVIEIDGASNRGIDDAKQIRENVRLVPSRSRYKIYIIDEVHQLSRDAFNALLKTIEEPPPHAVFILATTESHKVPATIVSRCQRYDFRRASLDNTRALLRRILDEEGIACGDEGGSVYLVDLVGISLGPIVVTAVDLGDGPTVRCPVCFEGHPLEEIWLGRELDCPGSACGARLRVNAFIAGQRAPTAGSWIRKWWSRW